MRVRHLEDGDIAALQQLADASGFPYPDLNDPLIEVVQVVVDSQDRPVVAIVAKRLVEIYMYVDAERSPVVKMDALKLAHPSMAAALRDIGYQTAECFLPPEVQESFGNRLIRTFGWVHNWHSFGKSL